MQTRTLASLKFVCFSSHTFLFLCSLSPDSVMTDQCFFLSCFSSFLIVASWWLSHFYRCFLPLWSGQSCMHCQKCCNFAAWKNSGHLVSETNFCGAPRQSYLKPIEVLLSQKHCDWWDPYTRTKNECMKSEFWANISSQL